jgi:preprotein translocase subunit SecB
MVVQSPNLEDFRIEKVLITPRPNFNINSPEVSGEFDIEIQIAQNKENTNMYLVILKIVFADKENKDNFPYNLEFQINGIFSINDDMSEEEKEKLIALNAVSILYGVARGEIANFTANFKYEKFILPSYNFVEHYKKSQNKSKTKVSKQNK